MTFTKNAALMFALTLFPIGAYAETTCPLAQSPFGVQHNIEEITLQYGEPGSVSIRYKDGAVENLQPESAVAGPFGEIKFRPHMKTPMGKEWLYTRVTSKSLGVIQARAICYFPYSDLNCNSFAGGHRSTEDKVQFNFNDQVVSFDGKSLPLCSKK